MESSPTSTGQNLLASRTARQPDYATENQALVRLAKAQTGPRAELLNAIAETALKLSDAGSAGISLVEGAGANRRFRWLAVAGICEGLKGKTTAWGDCPCAVALEAEEAQLFVRHQEQFPCLQFPGIHVPEGLVVPIPGAEAQLGAIWVMSHSDERQFDGEDVRLLSNLAVFAGAAITVVEERDNGIESDQRHNEFIAMLGHELRNPMAPIDSAIGVAKRVCADNATAVEVLTVAQRQVRHLRTLVDDLLDAARLKHGKLAIKYSDTSLNEISFDAVTTVKHHIESRRHTLTLTGLDATVPVRADHVRLSQVLGNILSNAAKYTPVGGTIEMDVVVDERDKCLGVPGAVTISIKDNGIGIDDSMQPHMFELFAQSARGHARAEGGLGIGLAVAKRMVELHEGTITLESRGPGVGTVVTLRLPILRAAADPEAKEISDGSETRSMRLLLVDDNEDALRSLAVLLELEGHVVTTVNTGRDAIRLISEMHPEIAIVDIGMPDVDGFDVARAVRAVPNLSGVLLVALTGYAAESDKSRALAAGFDYHLTKPLSLEKLQHIIQNRTEHGLGGIV
jgi:signal transduction histidine kinase/CheY-like chemotaxis protein